LFLSNSHQYGGYGDYYGGYGMGSYGGYGMGGYGMGGYGGYGGGYGGYGGGVSGGQRVSLNLFRTSMLCLCFLSLSFHLTRMDDLTYLLP
jgi:hypothetical protein